MNNGLTWAAGGRASPDPSLVGGGEVYDALRDNIYYAHAYPCADRTYQVASSCIIENSRPVPWLGRRLFSIA